MKKYLQKYIQYSGIIFLSILGTNLHSVVIGIQDVSNAVAIQTDGKIVASGYSLGDVNSFLVVRYTSGGVLDPSFNGNGTVVTLVGTDSQSNGVAIDGSGNIIAVGYGVSAGVSNFALARYTSSGSLDGTFGTGGITLTPIGTGATINAVALDGSGNIVVAGTAIISGNPNFVVARYTSAGVLDGTFNGGSPRYYSNWGPVNCLCISNTRRWKIVLAGVSAGSIALSAVYYRWGIGYCGFNFGGPVPGTVVTTLSSNDSAFGVGLQSDGKIVIAGFSNGGVVLARYINDGVSDGTLDTTYNASGPIPGTITTFVGTVNKAAGIAIQSNDKAVVAGYFDTQLLVGRYTTSGTVDTAFGNNGFVTIPCVEAQANAVTLQGDGKIVVAGTVQTDCLLARISTSGIFDSAFGSNSNGIVSDPQGSLSPSVPCSSIFHGQYRCHWSGRINWFYRIYGFDGFDW